MNVNADNPLGYIYLRFAIPPGPGELLSAKLRLYCVNSSSKGGYVRVFSDLSWDENAPTFNQPLLVDGPCVGVFGEVTAGSWVETDITAALATGLISNQMISLALYPTSDDGADYQSKEGAHPPELKLNYAGHRRSLEPADPNFKR